MSEANDLNDARITQVVQDAADVAYRARVRLAAKNRIRKNTLSDLVKDKGETGTDGLRQSVLAERVTRHGIQELIDSQMQAGISKERWLALSSSTRAAESPEEFQAFARVLRVSAKWLAIGSGSSTASSGFEEPPAGWATFGSHVDRPGVPLEFSTRVGEDGMPLWERPRESEMAVA